MHRIGGTRAAGGVQKVGQTAQRKWHFVNDAVGCSLSLVGHVRVALVASTSGDKVGDAVGEPRARPQTARRHRAMNERGAMVFEKDSNLPERTVVTSS